MILIFIDVLFFFLHSTSTFLMRTIV